jgi:hypothetical protein
MIFRLAVLTALRHAVAGDNTNSGGEKVKVPIASAYVLTH